MGQSETEGVLRLYAVVLALRQRDGAEVSGALCQHGTMGQPGAILRAGKVGRQAAQIQGGRESADFPNQYAGRTRWKVGAVSEVSRGGRAVRVYPRCCWKQRGTSSVPASITMTRMAGAYSRN